MIWSNVSWPASVKTKAQNQLQQFQGYELEFSLSGSLILATPHLQYLCFPNGPLCGIQY